MIDPNGEHGGDWLVEQLKRAPFACDSGNRSTLSPVDAVLAEPFSMSLRRICTSVTDSNVQAHFDTNKEYRRAGERRLSVVAPILMNLSVVFHFRMVSFELGLASAISALCQKPRAIVNVRNRSIAFARLFGCAEHSRDSDQIQADSAGAVFLHGGWRCGSTYVWSRFRESVGTLCFYEPFHETLLGCRSKDIWRETTGIWNSRHPPLSRPYRYEYLPLLRMAGLRGVRRYREEFAVADYFPQESGIARQVDYLGRLVRHAHQSGKRAVFGFSRSLARAPAIRQALGGCHIVIRRDPRQQWLSCRSYRLAEGALYFELCHFLILALAPPQSPAGRYAHALGLPRPPDGRFREQFRFMERALWPWTDELSYRAFAGVSQLSHQIASAAADLVIDIDRLSNEPRYRSEVTNAIFGRTGVETRFDDCRIGRHDATHGLFDFEAVERSVVEELLACGATAPTEHGLNRAHHGVSLGELEEAAAT